MAATGIMLAGAILAGASPARMGRAGAQEVVDDPSQGLASWSRMEAVLTHPRCLNCHAVSDYPTQGNERRPHPLGVIRGADGRGAAMKCQACHGARNTPGAGIPGAPDWHMAPLALAWEKAPGKPADGAAICATLKRADAETGGPDYERLIEYAQFAPFVLWGWEPGTRRDGTARTPPTVSHEAFVDALKGWISAGAPCPPTQAATATGP